MLIFNNTREPNCICVKIQGGLGNQMFQYAAGLSAAVRLNTELLLELPAIGRIDHANFGLSIFNIDLNCFKLATKPESIRKLLFSKMCFWKSELERTKYTADPHSINDWQGGIYVQPNFRYDSEFDNISSPCLLEGYFQSYKFFSGVEDEVKKSFNLAHFRNEIGSELHSVCLRPNSVAVHIRRGDYANNPEVTAWHGLIDKDYYDRAKNILLDKSKNRDFIVFSDDSIEARRITSDWPNVFIVEGNSREIDLLAMMSCQDYIIANSTFSWWAAWLNENPNKTVISPKKWLVDDQSNKLLTSDLIPENWILL